MKKTLLALVVLVCAALTSYAQVPGEGSSGIRLSGGFNVGGTIGHNASDYPVASGVNLNLEIPVNEDVPLNIILKTGYTGFISKDGYSTGYSNGESYSYGSIVSFVPAQIGVRVYVNKLFFEGAAGASFCINSDPSAYTSKKTALLVSPAIGYGWRFGYSEKFGLDLSLAYEARIEPTRETTTNYDDGSGFSTSITTSTGAYNQVALRVAFSFGL
ncbi:hypothetical protein [Mucilaginibacter dorajii]|uniref:Outer membrane protein beta-barrel domain-containing protein n=1 Tax=Mucilaginibacter dorajii TaxID=692994 RepID=A0ABP7PHG2_9SPHI|nr:hypothetical protein [Mucilaginibacter dorajii]MCS3733372.1 hypothetical protein [Mucilaginibacter dorajii]